jgi:peptidoglycan/xylan/chitin deacetylase (PgdA/CDA1 family)
MRLAAISVDLDEIPNYVAIHGLDEAGLELGAGRTAVYDVAVDRLLGFAEEEGIPLTLFAIGKDLARPEAAAKLREAVFRGHEIANHTLDHRYDLTRMDRAAIEKQILGGADAITAAVGKAPIGFRAPGYTITDTVMDLLLEHGYAYDSSVFPCPAYWAAKTAAIGLYKVQGRESRSVVDTPSVLGAPTRPYFVGRPYWRRGTGMAPGRTAPLVELPIQVTPRFRLPVFGTPITLAGPEGAPRLVGMCSGEPLVNLHIHGIDVLDEFDGLGPLRPHQLDVRVVKQRKLAALRSVIATLRADGYRFVRLDEAAKNFV